MFPALADAYGFASSNDSLSEIQPSDWFGMNLKVSRDTAPSEAPFLGLLSGWGPRLAAGNDPCDFCFILVRRIRIAGEFPGPRPKGRAHLFQELRRIMRKLRLGVKRSDPAAVTHIWDSGLVILSASAKVGAKRTGSTGALGDSAVNRHHAYWAPVNPRFYGPV